MSLAPHSCQLSPPRCQPLSPTSSSRFRPTMPTDPLDPSRPDDPASPEAAAPHPAETSGEAEEKGSPQRVPVKNRPGSAGSNPGRQGGPKKDVAAQLAMAFETVTWEESSQQEEALVGEGVGDFARGSDSVGGSAPKGKRGGRRSADSDGRRRRSTDSEGRRKKSWDAESRASRRRSGEGRRSGDSRKSLDNSRRSGESRKSSVSQASAEETEQLPQITDILLARLISSLSDSTLGNPALLLQTLLGFSPDDYNDLLAALSESRLSYVDIIAAYLHNIRVMSEDSGSASAALSGTLTRSLIEQYNNLLVQALKPPRPPLKPGMAASAIGDMRMRTPPIAVHPVPKPPANPPATIEQELPRGPSGLGFGRRSLDSLRQRQNFAIGMSQSAVLAPPSPIPRPAPGRQYPRDLKIDENLGAYHQPLPPVFPMSMAPVFPTAVGKPFPVPPPPVFQSNPPMVQQPAQLLPEHYAALLNGGKYPTVGIVPGLVPIPGLEFASPGLVAGVAGIPVPTSWQQHPQGLETQQGMASWSQPAAPDGSQSAGQAGASGWHVSLPVVQEHEQMDHANAGYHTG